MTSPIVDFSEIDLTGSVKFEDQQIGSVYYNGERLWPFGVDLLYTGGIGGASYLPDAGAVFADTAAATPAAFGGSIARTNPAGGSGNALQASASLQPLLGRAPKERRNLLTWTEQFDNAAWVESASPAVTLTNQGGGVWRLQAPAGSWLLYQSRPATGTHTFSIEVKSNGAGLDGFSLMMKGVARGSDRTATNEWVRYSISGLNDGSGAVGIVRNSSLAAIDILIRFPQLETGSTDTAYQRVGAATDITEEGVQSYPFVSFDLADDRLDTVLPQAVTGDVVIAGRNGSVIAPHSYAANTTFKIGPTSYTGGTPGILRAIGDVVGWSILDKTLTAAERERLMRFYKRRGAKGLLVPGPELVTNGNDWVGATGTTPPNGASKAGWYSASDGTYSVADGVITITNGTLGRTGFYFPITVAIGSCCLVEWEGLAGGFSAQIRVTSTIDPNSASPIRISADTSGSNGSVITIPSPTATLYVSFTNYSSTQGVSVSLGRMSVRELRPEEEW